MEENRYVTNDRSNKSINTILYKAHVISKNIRATIPKEIEIFRSE